MGFGLENVEKLEFIKEVIRREKIENVKNVMYKSLQILDLFKNKNNKMHN